MTLRAPVVLVLLTAVIAACSAVATPAPPRAPTAAPTAAVSAAPTAAPASAASSGGTGTVGCPTKQPAPLGATDTRTVKLTTPKGDITIKVEGKLAPIATGNFVALASCGYYNNVVFHRLVPDFVIQAGDGQYGRVPNVDLNSVGGGGPGYTIQDEPVIGDYTRGTVAMARTPAPNSQGSQFFICLVDLTGQLDKAGGYVILGHVTAGMDVVDTIGAEPNKGQAFGNTAVNPEPMTAVTVSTP